MIYAVWSIFLTVPVKRSTFTITFSDWVTCDIGGVTEVLHSSPWDNCIVRFKVSSFYYILFLPLFYLFCLSELSFLYLILSLTAELQFMIHARLPIESGAHSLKMESVVLGQFARFAVVDISFVCQKRTKVCQLWMKRICAHALIHFSYKLQFVSDFWNFFQSLNLRKSSEIRCVLSSSWWYPPISCFISKNSFPLCS